MVIYSPFNKRNNYSCIRTFLHVNAVWYCFYVTSNRGIYRYSVWRNNARYNWLILGSLRHCHPIACSSQLNKFFDQRKQVFLQIYRESICSSFIQRLTKNIGRAHDGSSPPRSSSRSCVNGGDKRKDRPIDRPRPRGLGSYLWNSPGVYTLSNTNCVPVAEKRGLD